MTLVLGKEKRYYHYSPCTVQASVIVFASLLIHVVWESEKKILNGDIRQNLN